MLDACAITRNGAPTTDPVTGLPTTPTTTVYTGRCKVQSAVSQELNPEVGDATFTVQRLSVHLPVGAYAMAVGDVVTIATSFDPLLVDRKFRVVQRQPTKTLATAYRIDVEEVA
jgi:hypothetical protein